ncbi:MAG TPA: TRAP transporter large permease subunit [Gammaproteobacteria bacterium]|nr:TRAP transporter large permease subunit [Gammaproteobacteria bacterium]
MSVQPPSTALGRLFGTLVTWLNGAGVVWVFTLMFLISADIIGRAAFDHPIAGVTEMVSLSLVACVFLQLGYAVLRGRLMRVEMVIEPLEQKRPAAAALWHVVLAAVGVAVLATVAVGEWPDFLRAWRTDEFAGVEGLYTIPVWPIKLLIVLGSVVAALVLLRQIALDLRVALHGAGVRGWLAPLAVVLGALLFAVLWQADLEPRTVGLAMIALVVVAIVIGMPIAIALLLGGLLGLALIRHDFGIATRTLALAAGGTVSDYVFATVPLFVLMGLFVNVSEIGRDAFVAAQRIFGRVYGGLGVATVAANAVFAAITGISIAAAAIFTKIAVPEMVRHGYTPKFAVGLTAGSSLLGMLIPPSLLLIIYGVLAEVSIGRLFLAAVLPGILLATAFAVGVILMAWLWPGFVGDVRRGGGAARQGGLGAALVGLVPVVVLIVLVLGGIYGGLFTPTEAGAAGALAAMIITLLKRRLDWPKLWEVISETGQVSVSILFLIIAASTFSRMLALSELPQDMAAFMSGTGLGLFGFLAAYLLLLLVLGTLLDSTSIMLIMLPLALPVATALGANLVWFGVITTIAIEIGLLTPPFGLSVFVIKASMNDPRISLATIFRGALPFVLITLAVTVLLMVFPQISLALL